jgi:hypothetical protein
VPNLWEVVEGCLYVSGHPEESAYRALFRAGMRGIVNLCPPSSLRLQIGGWGRRQGFFSLPVAPGRLPTLSQALQFLQIADDPDNLPLLVHSGGGGGLAAVLGALARYAIDGWPVADCLREAAELRGLRRLTPLARSACGEALLRQWAGVHPPGSFRPACGPLWGGLRFSGPAPHHEEMFGAWQALPDGVRALPVEVVEDGPEEWDLAHTNEPDLLRVAGYFAPGVVHLQIRYFSVRLFYHELGHAAWGGALTAGQRKDWELFWTQNPQRMPRDYARTNANEGFADCFALAYLGETPPGFAPLDRKAFARVWAYLGAAGRR